MLEYKQIECISMKVVPCDRFCIILMSIMFPFKGHDLERCYSWIMR